MKQILSAALSVIVVAGCQALPEYNYHPTEQSVSSPPLNEVREVGVGDEMVRHGKFVSADNIYVRETMPVTLSYTVTAGYYKKIGQTDDGEFFLPRGDADGGHIFAGALADQPQGLVLRENGNLCVVTASNTGACGTKLGFERRTREQPAENSVVQTIIYNGRVGDKISLRYRELANSVSSPPFNNSVEYDLGASKEIGYRGARIEVIEATPKSIKYRVLRNFDADAGK